MKSNVITPIQKVIIFQYNNKSYYEKCVFWLDYYMQWLGLWIINMMNRWRKYSDQLLEKNSQQNEWVKTMKTWLESNGVLKKQKKRRPKAINDMLEFVEVQYDNWEARVESKMKRENRESLEKVEDKEELAKGKWGSGNIDEKYYEKEEFENIYTQIVLEPDNDEEQKWKRRVMILYVPMIGNIMMYYDVFRMCFAYYSDTQGINYNILNACAMRYVCMFHCMDLFMDEMVELRFLRQEDGEGKDVMKYWKSPLRWVNKTVEQFHLENDDEKEGGKGEGGHRGIYGTNQKKKDEGKGIKLDKEERDKLFAKLKQYRTESVAESEIKLRNRFVYKGRTRDSCYHVFAKKVPEVKVAPAKVPLDTKTSFFSGILPLKMPKFWEVDEYDILNSNKTMEEIPTPEIDEKRDGDGNGDGNGYADRGEKVEGGEVNSYLEYKKKMGKKII